MLFVGLAALAGDSPYLRFIAVIIATLAVIGVIVHFIQGEVKHRRLSPDTNPNSSSMDKYKEVIQSKAAQEFWKAFVQGKLQVVTGHFTKEDVSREDKVWEPAGLIGAGDAHAIADLRTFFGVMGLSDFDVLYADRDYKDDDDARKRNLILLGASDYNPITKMAMDDIKSTLRFGPSKEGHQIAIYDPTTDGKLWDWHIDSESGTLTDYCLIVKTENPFPEHKGKQLLLVAGCTGFGTWAGIYFVTSLKFLEDDLVSSGAPCEFLIETKVRLGKPDKLKICRSGRLGEKLTSFCAN